MPSTCGLPEKTCATIFSAYCGNTVVDGTWQERQRLAFVRRGIGLQPHPQHGAEHRRLQRRAVQQGSIHAAEGLEVGGLFPRAFPFFIVPVVALLAFLGTDEDLLDLVDPIFRALAVWPSAPSPRHDRGR